MQCTGKPFNAATVVRLALKSTRIASASISVFTAHRSVPHAGVLGGGEGMFGVVIGDRPQVAEIMLKTTRSVNVVTLLDFGSLTRRSVLEEMDT